MKLISKFNDIKDIKKRITTIYKQPDRGIIIHYGCSSFDEQHIKIVSIAIKNLASGETQSFSIPQEAQKSKETYDKLEAKMLEKYFIYVENRPDFVFIHWNMRDSKYGFKALEDRYEALTGIKAYKIPDDKKFDLSRGLILLYGENYIGHGEYGRLVNIISLNNITFKDGLTGNEEANAFKKGEYQKIIFSTLRKVDCLQNILDLVRKNSLKVSILPIDNRFIINSLGVLEFLAMPILRKIFRFT